MSQPLSGVTGKKVPIQNEKRKYMTIRTDQNERQVSLREAVTILLIVVGAVCAPVGAGVAWGIGVGVFTAGVVALILAVILGVL